MGGRNEPNGRADCDADNWAGGVCMDLEDGMSSGQEEEATILLANKILDRPGGADPDDDLAMLSRQFLRGREEIARLKALLTRAADGLEIWIAQADYITATIPEQQLIAELRKAAGGE